MLKRYLQSAAIAALALVSIAAPASAHPYWNPYYYPSVVAAPYVAPVYTAPYVAPYVAPAPVVIAPPPVIVAPPVVVTPPPVAAPAPVVVAPPVVAPTPDPTIRWVQQSLNALNNAGLAVDGVYGPNTAAAIVRFQNLNGLNPDGIAGPATLGAINSQFIAGNALMAHSPVGFG